jgi:hypothetical protein
LAFARIALGQAQIVGAVMTLILVVQSGTSALTAWTAAVTAFLFLASVLFSSAERADGG